MQSWKKSTSKGMPRSGSRASRRAFLGGMAAGTAGMLLPNRALAVESAVAPNSKTTLACIGMGGQGHINLFNFLEMEEVQVVAVCDVNREGGGFLSGDCMIG